MKRLFNKVLDINQTVAQYPVAEDSAIFYFTEDNRFFIYALYTRRDLSTSKLIEVSLDTYTSELNTYKGTHGKDPITLYLPSAQTVEAVCAFAKYKATVDNMSLEDLYNLNYKGE